MIPVCEISEIPAQGGRRVQLAGCAPVAVFRAGTEYFVTDDRCTHGEGSLADGEVFGVQIECPIHQGAFDLRTGAPTARPCTVPLRTYRTEVRGNTLYAAIASQSESADAEDNGRR